MTRGNGRQDRTASIALKRWRNHFTLSATNPRPCPMRGARTRVHGDRCGIGGDGAARPLRIQINVEEPMTETLTDHERRCRELDRAFELDELAASIKANGLLQPIVIDTEGAILDGRHRLKACQKADVKPRFETYKGRCHVCGFYLSIARGRCLKRQRLRSKVQFGHRKT
jgi:hypothetical protein